MYEKGVNGNGETIRDFYVVHEPVDIDCSHDGLTRQEFAAECDINTLLARYETTGVLNHYNAAAPAYLDLSEGVPDLHSALTVLDRAQAAFMTLPARVRAEFDNDPVKFVAFAEDTQNIDKMREWGLAAPVPEAPRPVQVEVVSPPAPASGSSA